MHGNASLLAPFVFLLVVFGLVYLAGRVFAVGVRHERQASRRRDRHAPPRDPAPAPWPVQVRDGDPEMARHAQPPQPNGETDR